MRRRGLGRLLFRTLLAHARSVGAARLFLTTPSVNATGLAFYGSLGFGVERAFTVHDYGTPLEISRLELALPAGGRASGGEG